MKPLHRIIRFVWNQKWIDLRHKKAIYKKLCSYEDALDAPFAKDFFGLTYKGNLNNSVEFTLFYMGAFEKPLLFFLRDTMLSLRQSANGSAQSFFDIGANIGQHSFIHVPAR